MHEPVTSRRQFLLGLIAAAAVFGAGVKPGIDQFSGELGRFIHVFRDDWDLARELLVEDARKVLPRGAKFDIRLGSPTYYGRSYEMAWYADDEVQSKAEIICEEPKWVPEGGYYLFGRYACP